MKKNDIQNINTVIFFGICLGIVIWLFSNGDFEFPFPTPTPTNGTSYTENTKPPPNSTETPSATLTPTHFDTPTSTSTQYMATFPILIRCREEHSTSSEVQIVLQGHQVTILGRNEIGDWLFVSVEGFNQKCWLKRIDLLSLNDHDILRVPTIIGTFGGTFTPQGSIRTPGESDISPVPVETTPPPIVPPTVPPTVPPIVPPTVPPIVPPTHSSGYIDCCGDASCFKPNNNACNSCQCP